MSSFRRIIVLLPVWALSACSVLPMPEDVTNVETKDIVQHIRCETRDAVFDAVLKFLDDTIGYFDKFPDENEKNIEYYKKLQNFKNYRSTTDSKYYLVNKIYSDILQTAPAKRTKFDNTLLRYSQASIEFEFNLAMLASDHTAVSSTISHPFTTGTFGFNLATTGNFDRQNTLIFRVSDEFGQMVTNLTNDKCESRQDSNYIYPIVGKIGIDKVINTSVYLNEYENLTLKADTDKNKTVAAQIKFTTLVSQQFDPKLGLNPRGHFVQISAFELNSTISRTDTHEVDVAFVVPLKFSFVPQQKPPNPNAQGQSISTLPVASDSTKKRASEALDDLKATINGTTYATVVKTVTGQ